MRSRAVPVKAGAGTGEGRESPVQGRYRARGGPEGRPPEAIAAHGEGDQGHRAPRAGSWARRDLNPHVLADTRT